MALNTGRNCNPPRGEGSPSGSPSHPPKSNHHFGGNAGYVLLAWEQLAVTFGPVAGRLGRPDRGGGRHRAAKTSKRMQHVWDSKSTRSRSSSAGCVHAIAATMAPVLVPEITLREGKGNGNMGENGPKQPRTKSPKMAAEKNWFPSSPCGKTGNNHHGKNANIFNSLRVTYLTST